MAMTKKLKSVEEQALEWVVRLRSDQVTDEDINKFSNWLSAGAAQRNAWDNALDTWTTLGVVELMPLDSLMQSEAATRVVNFPARQRRSWRPFAAAATVLLASVLVWSFLPGAPDPQSYQTAVGESRLVDLADGTAVELNTTSEILVVLDKDERRVQLLRGEAYFDVAPDKQRPFRVVLGEIQAEALGTAFNIFRKTPDDVTVVVSEGVVRVSEVQGSATSAAQSRLVLAGQSISYQAGQRLAEPVEVDIDRQMAWRRGQLVFENTSIADAVTALNRYSVKKISLGNGTGNLKLSGTFSLRQPQQTLHAVAQAANLNVEKSETGWLLSPQEP